MLQSRRHSFDAITVRHPHGSRPIGSDSFEEISGIVDRQIGSAVLAMRRFGDLSPAEMRHQLHAVANAEHGLLRRQCRAGSRLCPRRDGDRALDALFERIVGPTQRVLRGLQFAVDRGDGEASGDTLASASGAVRGAYVLAEPSEVGLKAKAANADNRDRLATELEALAAARELTSV